MAAGAAATACVILSSACQGAPTVPPTPPAACPDFTSPGAATAMVGQLVAAAKSSDVVMVEVRPREVDVSVLVDQKPVTWACRAGVIAQVASDIAYVDQASFDPASFDFGDVGALLRAAAAWSGSSSSQRLQIVEYSGGRVMMSVATDPESRTVFFNPDGSLLEDLDFATRGGITRGLREVVGQLPAVTQVSITSNRSVWADHPGSDPGTVTRRMRTATVPVTTITRQSSGVLATFPPSLVRPEVVWSVVQDQVGSTPSAGTSWSVVIEDRDSRGVPRMHFSFPSGQVVTDLAGRTVGSS